MAKVLYISYDGMTDNLGQSQVMPYLSGLSKLGHEINLISAEKSDVFNRRKESIGDVLKSDGILWHPVSYTKKPPILSTLMDIRKIRKKAREICIEQNIQIIHCRSYIAAMVGLQLKKELGVRFVFDMRAFYADERVDGNIWPQSNPLYRWVYKYFKKKELEFLEQADHTITLTAAAKEEIHSWQTVENNPIAIDVIPCCADLSLFDYRSVSVEQTLEKKAELGITAGEQVLLYLGSIGTWYLMEDMLAFYKQLLVQDDSWKMVFISGEDPDMIHKAANEMGLDSSRIIIRKANRKEVPAYLSVGDLGIFFIIPAFSKKGSSPTKHGEMMGMGIPLICNQGVGDTAEIVTTTKTGLALKELQEDHYKMAISQLDQLMSMDKSHIREQAFAYFDLHEGVKKYHQIYSELEQV